MTLAEPLDLNFQAGYMHNLAMYIAALVLLVMTVFVFLFSLVLRAWQMLRQRLVDEAMARKLQKYVRQQIVLNVVADLRTAPVIHVQPIEREMAARNERSERLEKIRRQWAAEQKRLAAANRPVLDRIGLAEVSGGAFPNSNLLKPEAAS